MGAPRIERGLFIDQTSDSPLGPGGATPEAREKLFAGKNVLDARSAGLSNWFGESAIYVDTVERDENEKGGVGRFIVTKDQCDSQKDASFKGTVVSVDQRNIVSELPITAGHARDHFKEGRGSVLPGHKTIRIAVNTMEQLAKHISGKSNLSVRLAGFESVQFSRPVLPDKTMRVSLTLAQGDASSREFKGRAEVTIDGQPAAVIEGLSCEVTDTPQDGLLEDQLIEAGIQAAGLVGLGANKMQEGSLPAFARIGKAQFYERPKPGEAVWSAVVNMRKPSEERFAADVTLVSYGPAGEQIAGSFADAEAVILTPARARRIFG